MSEVTDLVVIEKQNAMAVFTTKEQLDPIIEAIEKEARSLVPDVSTRKGRDAIASMAHKVDGWLMPWGEVVSNPLKAQRLAEEYRERQEAA